LICFYFVFILFAPQTAPHACDENTQKRHFFYFIFICTIYFILFYLYFILFCLYFISRLHPTSRQQYAQASIISLEFISNDKLGYQSEPNPVPGDQGLPTLTNDSSPARTSPARTVVQTNIAAPGAPIGLLDV
jgi:hypothetical protein